MNKIIRILGIATLVACITTGVEAQEKRKEKRGKALVHRFFTKGW